MYSFKKKKKNTLQLMHFFHHSAKEDPFVKQLTWEYSLLVNDLRTNWSINFFTMYTQYKLPHLPFLEKN